MTIPPTALELSSLISLVMGRVKLIALLLLWEYKTNARLRSSGDCKGDPRNHMHVPVIQNG